MAFQSSDGLCFSVRTEQQGSNQGRGKVHPRTCRIAFSEAECMAGAIDQATGARGDFPCFGERLKHCILVVEDNQLNRELLRDWLEVEGYEFWSAADLKASYEVFSKRLPEPVLLDINIGPDNCPNLLAWIHQKPNTPQTPRTAFTPPPP